jgi:hypothetical protein
MKTARFAEVVKQCGEPEAHLLLIEPSKDRESQAAIKAKRVMTVFQDTVGTKADRGVVGFEPGPARQFLIFPKALRGFEAKNIVGIKYELWSTKEPSKAERAAPVRVPKKKAKRPEMPNNILQMPPMPRGKETAPEMAQPRKAKTAAKVKTEPKAKPEPPRKQKLAGKADPKKEAHSTRSEEPVVEISELKEKVRAAMAALEQGKQIAAFNILKGVVDD